MVTITKPSQPETTGVSAEPEAAVAPIISAGELAELMAEPVTTENGSLLNEMVHGLEAVYEWLFGPGTTERDRLRREIAEARPNAHTLF